MMDLLAKAKILADSILEIPELQFQEDNNGPGDWTCHMCYETVRAGKWNKGGPTLPVPFTHAEDCPRLQALAFLNLFKAEASHDDQG